MKSVLYTLALLLLFACKPEMEKKVTEQYPDGKPKLIQYFTETEESKDSLTLVKEEAYYENEKVKYSGEFKDSLRDGKWVYYYENGKVWSEGYFKKGVNHGPRTTYYENGSKRYEGQYVDGRESGVWLFYDETGKLIKEVDFEEMRTPKSGNQMMDSVLSK